MYCLACGHHHDKHDAIWLQVRCKGNGGEPCNCNSFQVDLKDTAAIEAHIQRVNAAYRKELS